MISGIGALDRIGAGAAQPLDRQQSPEAPSGLGASFGAVINEAGAQTVDKLNQAEQASVQALQQGNVETREVIDSVMSAEQSLQAAIAIRDKIVTAYLEMSRMSI